VLEQVMAEYFDAPPRIDFAMDGLCYQLNRSLEAMLGRTTVLPGGSRYGGTSVPPIERREASSFLRSDREPGKPDTGGARSLTDVRRGALCASC
jgi:hypothetical protein